MHHHHHHHHVFRSFSTFPSSNCESLVESAITCLIARRHDKDDDDDDTQHENDRVQSGDYLFLSVRLLLCLCGDARVCDTAMSGGTRFVDIFSQAPSAASQVAMNWHEHAGDGAGFVEMYTTQKK